MTIAIESDVTCEVCKRTFNGDAHLLTKLAHDTFLLTYAVVCSADCADVWFNNVKRQETW